jgi:maleate isomerase
VWQPDGAGSLARIGLLIPHTDVVPESEFQAMAPDGVSIHAARVPLGMVNADGTVSPQIGPRVAAAFAEPPHVDNACMLLAAAPLNAIVYAFTSSSYVLGAEADDSLKARLQACAGTIPVVIATQAACAALRAVGSSSIALIHPPWYPPELDRSGAAYFRSRGFDVVHHGAAPLRSEAFSVRLDELCLHIVQSVSRSADAVFLGGNGFRTIGIIDTLERELGCPVLTANQVAFWSALRLAGVKARVHGYGRLFAED